MATNPKTPTPVITARDRLIAAYKSRRREFDELLAAADYDHAVAWTMFATRVCPELPHSYVLDAADDARLAIKYDARARQRIATKFSRARV
ncbi:MAG: hypothetical protein PHS14_16005 [Elusimicrobia bacterium]|nr:hypothetical protein [Elusimicrobiota bacterium]